MKRINKPLCHNCNYALSVVRAGHMVLGWYCSRCRIIKTNGNITFVDWHPTELATNKTNQTKGAP